MRQIGIENVAIGSVDGSGEAGHIVALNFAS
jgi:hypothetical protein